MAPEPASEALPPLYARWVNELLGGPIPRESRATCESCAMRPGSNPGLHGAGTQAAENKDLGDKRVFFDAVVKCCTYQPTLYNFLVGGILADEDVGQDPGRATVDKRIAERIGVTPLGLMQTPTFSLLYNQSKHSFGTARALKCPHYIEEGGRCGVWRHRESTCATWFCKHVKGNTGYAFWREGLHSLLQLVEIGLARWCLLELGVSDALLANAVESKAWKAEAEAVTGDVLNNQVDERAYGKSWGEWRGRERAFYIRCRELVDQLSWADVLEICGPDAAAYGRLTVKAYERLVGGAPSVNLSVGSFELIHLAPDATRIKTYSEYDPIEIPTKVMELLAHFDGRPTADVLVVLADEHGIRLEPALIEKMVDFQLLVPAAEA